MPARVMISMISKENTIPSASPWSEEIAILRPENSGANLRIPRPILSLEDSLRVRGANCFSILMRASFSSSATRLASAALSSALPARSFAFPASSFDAAACRSASAIFPFLISESALDMRSFSVIMASCVSASELLLLLITNCVKNTPNASIAVRKTKTIYHLFHAAIDALKSWARAVKRSISDTFSPLSLTLSLIFVTGAVRRVTYKCI